MAKNKVIKKDNTWMIVGGIVAIALVGMIAFSANAQGVRGIFCKVGILDCTFSVDEYSAVLANLLPDADELALGAGSSHATDPFIEVGNVERFYYSQIMTQGQTDGIICSFLSPAATSTVTGGLIIFEFGSTTAMDISVAKATSATATTTALISDVTLATGIKGTIHIDPAVAATLDATQILAPSTYVNVGISGLVDGGGDFVGSLPVGSCSLELYTS